MKYLEHSAPDEIYLITGDVDSDCNFEELKEVTWADEAINVGKDIKYVKVPKIKIPREIVEALYFIDGGEFETDAQKFIELYNENALSEILTAYCSNINNFNLCILFLVNWELNTHLFEVEE